MWDLRVCRGCLVTEPAGKLEPISKMLKMGYQTLTGLEIKDGEGYPTYFCLECCYHIKKAWAFRRKSRRAFFAMREIMIIRNEVTIRDILTINREKSHLNSSCSLWNVKSNTIFNIDRNEDEKFSMAEYTPIIDNSVCHTIEVIPEITLNIEEQEIETAEEETIDNVDDIDDNDNNNVIQEEIDLEDVFKDLKEDSSSESELEELKVESVEKKTYTQYPSHVYSFDVRIYKACKALCNTTITVLTKLEQHSMHVIRSKMYPFVTAKFKCALCLSMYTDIAQLMKHIGEHKANQGEHKCQVCKNSFATTQLLTIHTAENHLYQYTCKLCPQTMYSLLDVISHNETNHPDILKDEKIKMNSFTTHFDLIKLTPEQMHEQGTNTLACEKCDKYFRNRNEWSEHVSKHDGPKRHFCDICLKSNKLKRTLQWHMIRFHWYNYRCKECSQVFTNRFKVKGHIRNGSCSKTDAGKCNLCNKKLALDYVRYHNWYIHYSEVYVHPCNLCGHSYITLYALFRHQFTTHKYISPMDPKLGDPEHACSTCNVQFYSRKAYETHAVRANHPEVENFANACRPCRMIFDNEELYNDHIRNLPKHFKYPRICDYCDLSLNNHQEREEHHKKMHQHLSHKQSHKCKLCEICGKILPGVGLFKHMARHNGDFINKYDCNRCEPATSWPNVYDYIDHVMNTHTHKPYHCTVCFESFRYRSGCRDHILKIHAPVMLYVCGRCEQQFSHQDYLRDHSRKIHDITINKIKLQRKRRNVFVYPHMKIDVSLIEEEIIKSVKIDLYDYLHKKYVELDDATNYLITEPLFQNDERPIKRRAQNTGTRRSKQAKRSLNDKLISDNCVVTTRTVVFKKKNVRTKAVSNEIYGQVSKDEVKSEDFQENKIVQDMGMNETDAAVAALVNNDQSVVESEACENDIKSDVLKYKKVEIDVSGCKDVISHKVLIKEKEEELPIKDDLDATMSEEVVEETTEVETELLEINGENYVMLNGILYKVATQ